MFPIRDTIPSKRFPLVNITLIFINVLIFMVEMGMGPDLDRFIHLYGLVPARYSAPGFSGYYSMGSRLFSMVSFMFLHGGFWHLVGNMWTLYIFGDNVEDHMGSFKYLLFYMLCGFTSGLTHLVFNLHSNVPTIGASGAVAGVMGAYFILYPRSKILTLVPILIIPFFFEIPAVVYLGVWFFLQFIQAAGSSPGGGGIAWWAHIGGFVFGILFLKLMVHLPRTGLDNRLNNVRTRKQSPRLQVIRVTGGSEDANLYGTITITPHEAYSGARKLVNIPWGFHNRFLRISVPPGIRADKKLRLSGLGKSIPGGGTGDIMLRVVIN